MYIIITMIIIAVYVIMSIIIMQIIVADQWISNLLCADAVDCPDDDQVGGENVPGQG